MAGRCLVTPHTGSLLFQGARSVGTQPQLLSHPGSITTLGPLPGPATEGAISGLVQGATLGDAPTIWSNPRPVQVLVASLLESCLGDSQGSEAQTSRGQGCRVVTAVALIITGEPTHVPEVMSTTQGTWPEGWGPTQARKAQAWEHHVHPGDAKTQEEAGKSGG